MKSQFECLFIIQNDVKEETRNALVEKWVKMTGDASAKVEKWGLKKFATPINYKKDGYYFLMNFASTPDVPQKIGKLMNITDGMVRYMFVNKDEQLHKAKNQKVKNKKVKAEVPSE